MKGRVMPRNRDYDDFDDEDEDEDGNEQGADDSKLVRTLRKQLKAKDKTLEEINDRLAKYEARDRQETVGSVLKAAEVNEKYARWVVRDLEGQEITEESVRKWVEDNADLVGFQAADAGSTVDEGTQESLRRIQSAERGASGTPDADPIAAKLADPNLTAADLEQILGKPLGF
jgi:hypothetical protein